MLQQKILMIQKLLNIQKIWLIFIKTNEKYIKFIIQMKNVKILLDFDDMIGDMLSGEKLNPVVTELLFRSRKLKTSLLFLPSFIFLCQRIVHTILLWKFQINEKVNKLHPKIHQILTFKIFLIFTKN